MTQIRQIRARDLKAKDTAVFGTEDGTGIDVLVSDVTVSGEDMVTVTFHRHPGADPDVVTVRGDSTVGIIVDDPEPGPFAGHQPAASAIFDTLHTVSVDILAGPWALSDLGGTMVFVHEDGDIVPLSSVTWAVKVDIIDPPSEGQQISATATVGAILDTINAAGPRTTDDHDTRIVEKIGEILKAAGVV